MTGSAYFLVVIMVTMAIVLGVSLNMEYLELKLLPSILSIAIFIFAAIALTREILPVKRTTGSETTVAIGGEARLARRHWIAYSWLAGYFLAIYLFGFLVAIVILVLAYMRTHNGRWLAAISLAILLPVLAYTLFDLLLNIELYQGLVFIWLERMIWAYG